MPNALLTSSIIQKEALMILENELTFSKNVNREYDDKFGISGAKIGATINARKPPRYQGRSGQALQIESSTEDFVPITLTEQFGVDISFSSQDLTLHIDEFRDRFLKPAMATIANKIDYDGLQLFKDINRIVYAGANGSGYGTAGLLTGGTATAAQVQSGILAANAILTESGVPKDGNRGLVLSPGSTVGAITPMVATQFNSQQKLSQIFGDASVGSKVLGFDWAEDANTASFAAGAFTGATTTATFTAGSSTVTFGAAVATSAIPKGAVFTVAGIFAVNPQSRQSTGRLQQFVMTADAAVGATTASVYPPHVGSGQFQTVTGTLTGNITWITPNTATPYDQNLAYHRDAFTLASADLLLPGGVDMAERANYKGISMRMVRQYDINSDQFPVRFDVLYGWKTIYRELACRVGG